MRKVPHKKSRANLNLGDLVMAVSSCSKSNRETIAAVADLIESGRVRFRLAGKTIRGHIC